MSTIGALLVAATLSMAFEIGLQLSAGVSIDAEYLAVCLGLTLGAALLLGIVAAAVSAPAAMALGLWVGLNAGLDVPKPSLRALLIGVAVTVLTWLILRSIESRRRAGVGDWILVGAAVSLVVSVLPRTHAVFGPLLKSDLLFDLGCLLGIALLLVSVDFASRSLSERGFAHGPLLVASLVTVLMWGAVAIHDRPAKQPDWVSVAGPPSPDLAARPSILVLILDTVRADHLSVYGSARDTTPALRRFVEERPDAAVYPRAFSVASWTVPSHASLFTGEIPSTHGLHSSRFAASRKALRSVALPSDQALLAEVMKEAGYRTAAIFANPVLSLHDDLQAGFDLFIQPRAPVALRSLGEALRRIFVPSLAAHGTRPTPDAWQVNSALTRVLAGCDAVPCFVVANYMDAHGPYTPKPTVLGTFSGGMSGSPPVRSRMDDSSARVAFAEARYDEQLLGLDRALAALLDELATSGFLDRSWLVITSDHGEAFGAHDLMRHGTGLYSDQVRIPLIVNGPRGTSLRATEKAVSLLDVTQTLSAIGGAEAIGVGRDLRAFDLPDGAIQMEFFGHFGDGRPEIYGELAKTPARAVLSDGWKLLEHGNRLELFRIADDPGETTDLAAEFSEVVAALSELLPPLDAGEASGESEERELSREEIESLRALGYIQ